MRAGAVVARERGWPSKQAGTGGCWQPWSHLSATAKAKAKAAPLKSRPLLTLKPAALVVIVAADAFSVVAFKSANAGSKGSISLSHAVADVDRWWRYQGVGWGSREEQGQLCWGGGGVSRRGSVMCTGFCSRCFLPSGSRV